jgi:hypothetical protein
MPTQLIAIARNAFVESLRQPVLLLIVGISGILQVFNTASMNFAMGMVESSEVKGDNKLLFDVGLGTVFVCALLIAAFLATAVMSREIENKTVLTVVSKPVGRASVVIGKYLGVSGALLLATAGMLLFLLLAIRHGVLSTAADEIDQPVILFASLAVGLTLCLGAWCNYYYGWSFPQTATAILVPALLAAYVGVLFVGKEWKIQSPAKDFLPQVTLACGALAMAVLVLTAVATAASTRLGQVMTIVVCVGVFLASLLSNYFLGRFAFDNTVIARVASAQTEDLTRPAWNGPGETIRVTLDAQLGRQVRVGDAFFYGPSPSGYPMAHRDFSVAAREVPAGTRALTAEEGPSAMVVTSVDGQAVTVRHLGEQTVRIVRPPQPGDFVFVEPTRVRWPALVAWTTVPNLHYFWLLDAVTQNQHIPAFHVGLIAAYAVTQVGALLCLSIALFQRRDVG